tara:strand:- start:168 stop:335 length:168 start_codon:yes stop_codon:yes gene_type:complete
MKEIDYEMRLLGLEIKRLKTDSLETIKARAKDEILKSLEESFNNHIVRNKHDNIS